MWKNMSKLSSFFAKVLLVFFITRQCLSGRCVQGYRRDELISQHPGLGSDYAYYLLDNGTLIRFNLKSDEKTQEELKKFLKKEQDLESQNSPMGFLEGIADTFLPENFLTNIFGSNSEEFHFRSDITFTLYNRKIPDGINMSNYNLSEYDVQKPTKVVTHGFLSSGTAETTISIKNNYVNESDVNVIILDWGKIAADIIYPITAVNTGTVADYCAEFLGYLITNVGLKKRDIHLIGHSLGAHVVGFTGRRLIHDGFGKVARITGLDPAGPLFDGVHLNKKDAAFVDIIHTDAGFLGLNKSMGHIDFFPNGGESPQPGCESVLLLGVESCSHGKSWHYYANSILDESLYIGNCTSDKQYPMGTGTPAFARGNCTLDTEQE